MTLDLRFGSGSDAQRSVAWILERSMAATWWGTCKGIRV